MSEPQDSQPPMGAPYFAAPPRREHPLWRTLLWILVAIVAAGLLVLLLTPHLAKGPDGRGAGGRRPPTVVGVATAEPGDMPITLDELGTVTPVATVVVHTRIAGQLMRVDFREGQMVREGQLLAEVDPRPYEIARTEAEGQLLRDQAALANARLDLKRYQTLAAQDSVSRQTLDTQAALVKQDEGAVKTDEASLANARLNLVYCRVTAPVSGRISLRAVDPGNYVQTSDANGVASITTTDPIDVVFTIAEDNIPQVSARIASGASLTVTALDRSDTNVLATGALSTLDNQVDATTGTVKAKARFANAGGVLFPNQFVNAHLLVDTLQAVIIVPTAAVRHGPNSVDFVYTVDDPTGDPSAKMTPVKLGPADGERTAVLSGLQSGDRVVTEGGDRLRDGATIVLPGHAPQSLGPKPQAQGGLFSGLTSLFGKKPAPDQSTGAAPAQAGSGAANTPGQAPGQGAGGRGARMQAMLAQLGLDPDQKAKADAIFAEARVKAQASNGDQDAVRAAFRDANDKLKAILRPDQQAKFDALRARKRSGG